jgi:hypothetical protein
MNYFKWNNKQLSKYFRFYDIYAESIKKLTIEEMDGETLQESSLEEINSLLEGFPFGTKKKLKKIIEKLKNPNKK